MKVLFILNDPRYGSERTYNALRLAMALEKDHAQTDARIFLMADAVTAAIRAQDTPQGNYNIVRMLQSVMARRGHVGLCGTCCEARGVKTIALTDGAEVSTMTQLARWTVESEPVLVF